MIYTVVWYLSNHEIDSFKFFKTTYAEVCSFKYDKKNSKAKNPALGLLVK